MTGLEAPDYWLARLVFQRALAGIYVIAFLVAARQFAPLLGARGLLPVPAYVRAVPFRRAPSLFHFRYSDRLFAAVAWSGVALAAVALVGLPDAWPLPLTMLLWAVLWAFYLSIVNVGQTFYSFGWETLLLETGFLAIFLGPAWTTPPLALIWLVRRHHFAEPGFWPPPDSAIGPVVPASGNPLSVQPPPPQTRRLLWSPAR